MNWEIEKFSSILSESKIPSEKPDSNKRIRVRLNVKGVEKRPDTNDKKGATKQYIRKAGQFIYGKQNFHKGAFGIIPPELDGFETSADIPSFDIREDCLPEWIYYFFKAGNKYLELTKYARGVGSKRIHPKQIANLEIPLPPINIQKQIIEELKIIEKDEISTHLTHQLDLLKKLRQAFLREAMQGKLIDNGELKIENEETGTELLAKIKAKKKRLIKEKKIKQQKPLPPISEEDLPAGKAGIPFEIPDNWVWCRLGELFQDIQYGTSKKCSYDSSKNSHVLRIPNISEGKIDTEDMKFTNLTEKEKKLLELKVGDILIIRSNGSRNLVGKTVFVNSSVKGYAYAGYLIRLRFNTNTLFTQFIWKATTAPFFRKLIETPLRTTVGINNINSTEISKLLIPLPPLSEQKRIVTKLDELMEYCDNLEESIKNSQTQNKMLLQQVLREALEPKTESLKEEVIL